MYPGDCVERIENKTPRGVKEKIERFKGAIKE